jgi:hypothetical protein
MLIALAGLGRVRCPAERLLSLVALFMLLPVALSPANSPRNLSSGLVPLLLLAGTRLPTRLDGLQQRLPAALAGVGVLAAMAYGVGTMANLSGPSAWPSSTVVGSILRDASGWRDLGPVLAAQSSPLYAVDYSVAAQVRYYADRPAYTSWGQYRIWGVPEFENATIMALDYLPEELISSRLNEAFQHVGRLQHLSYTERGATKVVRLWKAEELRFDQETFLERFDFLDLLEASR